MSDLRTKLDAAIFNGHGGGSVSSRWTVDSILTTIMPIITSELALNQAAIVREAAAVADDMSDMIGIGKAILAIPTDQPALDKYNYSQWERGYGDGITGMGAVLAGAPLENLPEANREQARRWIDRHDAELKAQTAAMLEKIARRLKDRAWDDGLCRDCDLDEVADELLKVIPADYAVALNAMMVAALDRGFQAGQKEMQAGAPEREQP